MPRPKTVKERKRFAWIVVVILMLVPVASLILTGWIDVISIAWTVLWMLPALIVGKAVYILSSPEALSEPTRTDDYTKRKSNGPIATKGLLLLTVGGLLCAMPVLTLGVQIKRIVDAPKAAPIKKAPPMLERP